MNITAEAVKQLRERTGAGMMECKKALVETKGDLDAAAELMRKQGLAKADKKATRVAAEGVIVIARAPDHRAAAMVEVNCETDFVAREHDFRAYAQAVAECALRGRPRDLAALSASALTDGESVEERRRALIAKIGENISVRRYAVLEAPAHLGAYLHGTRIGALVALQGGTQALAHDLAMHVAASNPRYRSASDVPAEVLEKERGILSAQAALEGKPPEIVAKMVEGRLRKSLAEITLTGQPFVKDPDVSVEKLLRGAQAQVLAFERFEVGAGIEKKQDDFVAEVMAQVKGAGPAVH
ncbi:MAG: elongation factor Ts [Gammaproteobacteria bacterium]|nr:elongation factor Ts [Gammaproteobacteria bacterium]MBV9698048.1 elongation factor Ts [Gammaproteobacteria bacterium]